MHKVDACSVNIGVSLTLDMLTMRTIHGLVAGIYHNHIQHDLKLKLITILIYLVFDFFGEKKYIYIYLVCEDVLFC